MNLSNLPSVEHEETLTEKIHGILKQAIMHNKLTPGTLLKVRDISEQLNVSVTPVREALILLDHSGWVRQSGKNKAVVYPSRRELVEYAEVRIPLELSAFRLTRDRICPEWIEEMREILRSAMEYDRQMDGVNYAIASEEFHLYLCKKAGNRFLYKTLSEICDQMLRSNIIRYREQAESRHFLNEEHQQLVNLLEEQRWEDYELMLAKHIQIWPDFAVEVDAINKQHEKK